MRRLPSSGEAGRALDACLALPALRWPPPPLQLCRPLAAQLPCRHGASLPPPRPPAAAVTAAVPSWRLPHCCPFPAIKPFVPLSPCLLQLMYSEFLALVRSGNVRACRFEESSSRITFDLRPHSSQAASLAPRASQVTGGSRSCGRAGSGSFEAHAMAVQRAFHATPHSACSLPPACRSGRRGGGLQPGGGCDCARQRAHATPVLHQAPGGRQPAHPHSDGGGGGVWCAQAERLGRAGQVRAAAVAPGRLRLLWRGAWCWPGLAWRGSRAEATERGGGSLGVAAQRSLTRPLAPPRPRLPATGCLGLRCCCGSR